MLNTVKEKVLFNYDSSVYCMFWMQSLKQDSFLDVVRPRVSASTRGIAISMSNDVDAILCDLSVQCSYTSIYFFILSTVTYSGKGA
jgi:hypothetical protein